MNDIRKKIFNYVLTMVVEGQWSPNEKIPTENELAKQFKTNRMNAHFAIKMLEEEGVVKRTKRIGTFIKESVHSNGTILSLQSMTANSVHILASVVQNTGIHWNLITIKDIDEKLSENGFKPLHCELPDKLSRPNLKEIFDDIVSTGSCALAILPDRNQAYDLLDNLDILLQYPGEIYMLNRGIGMLDRWPFHSICMDPFGEGVMVARCLCEKGFRDIVFFEEDTNSPKYSLYQRRLGLETGLMSFSNNKLKPEIWKFPYKSMVKDCCRKIMESKKKLTIVAPRDSFAAELIMEAEKNSMSVPSDFRLISFDDNWEYRKYNLTSVAPPMQEVGKVFCKQISNIEELKKQGQKISIKMSSRLIERDTCL